MAFRVRGSKEKKATSLAEANAEPTSNKRSAKRPNNKGSGEGSGSKEEALVQQDAGSAYFFVATIFHGMVGAIGTVGAVGLTHGIRAQHGHAVG